MKKTILNIAQAMLVASLSVAAHAQNISTIVGGSLTGPGDGGAANLAFLNKPFGMTLLTKPFGTLPVGTLIIADQGDNRIRAITPNGIISTVAGAGGSGYVDGPANQAQFFGPQYVKTDAAGNLYVSDLINRRIRKIDASGNVTTVAGLGNDQDGPDGTQATQSNFHGVYGLAFDDSGTLYVADFQSSRVRQITTDGLISTLAGTGAGGFSGDGGSPRAAKLNGPTGLAYSNGNLYIADTTNARVRVVNLPSNTISTFLGCGALTDAPSTTCPALTVQIGSSGPASKMRLFAPQDVTVASDGSGVYVLDDIPFSSGPLCLVYKVDNSGTATQLTGASGICNGLSVISQNQIYMSEGRYTREVYAINRGVLNIYGGGGLLDGSQATSIGIIGPPGGLLVPASLKTDTGGNIYFSDYGENVVRKIDLTGKVTTIAGNGTLGSSGDGGQATFAAIAGPLGLDLDAAGNIYVAESAGNKVRKIAPNGTITTFAGTGTSGGCAGNDPCTGDGAAATKATLTSPTAVAYDASSGSLFIVDAGNYRIRKVDSAGNISTVAGGSFPASVCAPGNTFSCGDGKSAIDPSVTLDGPIDIVVDGTGAFYILERYIPVQGGGGAAGGFRIRKVDTSGKITTIAGNGNADTGGEGGAALSASLGFPSGLAIDKNSGALFVSDDRNNRILKVQSNVTRVAGSLSTGGYSGDGGFAIAAAINRPEGLVIDSGGNLLFWDAGNNRIRKITGIGLATGRNLILNDGNLQTGIVTTPATVLPKNLKVIVLDGGTTPVPGITVQFTVNPTTAATVSPASVVTDANGIASTQVTLSGSAGNFTVTASVNGLPTVTFNESAVATLGGVVNGASFATGLALAPGTISSLFGQGMAATSELATVLPLPIKLSTNTTLKVVGTKTLNAPLFYVSPGQVNFMLPFEITDSSVQLIINAGGVDSAPLTLAIADTAPGIFTTTSTGSGAGAILHGIGSQLLSAANPAKPGEVISIFCAGLGAVTPTVTSGAASGASTANATVTVTVGGSNAPVQYAGLAPGFAGLYQVNAVVPTGLAAGTAVPVIVSANGRASNTATIPLAAQ